VKKIPLTFALVFTGILLATLGCVSRTHTKVVTHDAGGIPVIDISGALDQAGAGDITRALQLAESSKPAFIIISLDSRGGEFAGALQVADTIGNLTTPTVGLVKQVASSSVLLIAAVDQIYFSPQGVCGPASFIIPDKQSEAARMKHKLQRYLGSKLKKFAEANGHDADIFLAMAESDTELNRGAKVWKKKGDLFTLNASDALAIGLSAGTVATVGEIVTIRQKPKVQTPRPPDQNETTLVPPELRERYLAAKQIEVEHRSVTRGQGDVLVGKLVRPSGVNVASRTPIAKDGSFATGVYPGRTLTFYAHGYDALVVTGGTEILPHLRDVGEQSFTPSPPDTLRTVSGTVSLAAPAPANPVKINAVLGITNSVYLYHDHGHRGGNISVKVRTLSLNSGERFTFEGLSPIPYDIKLSAPDYIARRITLDPGARGKISLDPVSLAPAPVLEFTYVAQLNLDDIANWDISSPTTQKIACDGDRTFRYTEARDKFRNRFYLRLKPLDAGVEASFWASPCQFYDLGPGVLATFLKNREWVTRLPELKPADRAILQPGHVYFFQEKSRATNCLFALAPAGSENP
jgi:ATP-dependent protease ClpP protease subunit